MLAALHAILHLALLRSGDDEGAERSLANFMNWELSTPPSRTTHLSHAFEQSQDGAAAAGAKRSQVDGGDSNIDHPPLSAHGLV